MKIICTFTIFLCLSFQSLWAAETRVLSLDGGGIRGVVTLELLRHLQNEGGLNLHEDFDLYCGTSTGAIIAVALACGMSVEDILHFYQELSDYVFGKESHLFLFHPKYDSNRLRKAIKTILNHCGIGEDSLIKDLPKKVVLTTVNLKTNSRSQRWEMDFIENVTPDGGAIPVIEALLQSTAAPTFFPATLNHVDGGMGMNDPSLAALMFAYSPESNLKDVTLLSIGTGYFPHFVEEGESWGTLKWSLIGSRESGHFPLVNLLLDLQADIPQQVLTKLLGNRYRKVDILLVKDVQLQEFKEIPYLIDYTKKCIRSRPEEWQSILKWIDLQFKTEGWWNWMVGSFCKQPDP